MKEPTTEARRIADTILNESGLEIWHGLGDGGMTVVKARDAIANIVATALAAKDAERLKAETELGTRIEGLKALLVEKDAAHKVQTEALNTALQDYETQVLKLEDEMQELRTERDNLKAELERMTESQHAAIKLKGMSDVECIALKAEVERLRACQRDGTAFTTILQGLKAAQSGPLEMAHRIYNESIEQSATLKAMCDWYQSKLAFIPPDSEQADNTALKAEVERLTQIVNYRHSSSYLELSQEAATLKAEVERLRMAIGPTAQLLAAQAELVALKALLVEALQVAIVASKQVENVYSRLEPTTLARQALKLLSRPDVVEAVKPEIITAVNDLNTPMNASAQWEKALRSESKTTRELLSEACEIINSLDVYGTAPEFVTRPDVVEAVKEGKA